MRYAQKRPPGELRLTNISHVQLDVTTQSTLAARSPSERAFGSGRQPDVGARRVPEAQLDRVR